MTTRAPGRLDLRWTAALYAAVVLVVDSPALAHAWWYSDDYPLCEKLDGYLERALENGRPLEALWFNTFALDGRPGHSLANVLLRLLSVAIHVGAAVAFARLLSRHVRPRVAALAPLPFLVWCFHGEAVLWRTAGTYPIAVLLSILGVSILTCDERRWRLPAGAALCAAAMWSNQAAAAAGIVAWLAVLSVRALDPVAGIRATLRRAVTEGTAIGLGYAFGGAVSLACARLWVFYPGPRAALARHPLERLVFLFELNRFFLRAPHLYPMVVVAAHALLLGGAAIVLGVAAAKRPALGVAIAAATLGAFVAPYATVLLTTQASAAFRLFYVAPLGLGLVWVIAIELSRSKRAVQWGLGATLLSLLTAYVFVAHANAREFMTSSDGDLRVVRELEAAAAAANVHRVAISEYRPNAAGTVHYHPAGGYNPHGLIYVFSNAHESTFTVPWAWPTFVRWYTHLEPVRDQDSVDRCSALARRLPSEPAYQLEAVPEASLLCLCPR